MSRPRPARTSLVSSRRPAATQPSARTTGDAAPGARCGFSADFLGVEARPPAPDPGRRLGYKLQPPAPKQDESDCAGSRGAKRRSFWRRGPFADGWT